MNTQAEGQADHGADYAGRRFGLRRSVFWKVAGLLVGMQVTTALLAVGLSAFFAYDQSLDLVTNSLRLRLDGLAEEVERRAAPLDEGLVNLPRLLRLDLANFFPDPLILLDADGTPLLTIPPDPDAFADVIGGVPEVLDPPPNLAEVLSQDRSLIQLDADAPEGTWGLTPIYDIDGYLVGGLLIQPLTQSIAREVAGTRAAFLRAFFVVTGLSVLIALLLGAFFTWQLVRPLQRVTQRVEGIGAGDYAARIQVQGDDEIGRLAVAVNRMAAEVEASIEALRATDRLRRDLIANIGHDLRTPLAALLGYAEEAERHLAEGARTEAETALETAARQGRYLKRLVDDLFELSVLDSARAPLRREPIPLGELLNDAANAHRAAFAKADIAFTFERPKSLPILEGDGVRLLRVLDNLLSNARRHTPAGSTVRLSATPTPTAIDICVADTGDGMTPEVLASVFERYYRGSDARTRTRQGTGLGLPIARAIARAHGGDLTAESAPGQGSTFTLHLPLG